MARIDSVISQDDIQKEFDFLAKNLTAIGEKIKSFPAIKVSAEGATNVKELSKAQIQYAESLKAVDQLVKQRFASEAKLVTLQTDYAKATAANRLEIQKQNAELKTQAQLNAANTGSVERARAAVKQLSTERDKLNLFTKEGRDRQEQLNASIDKYNAFIKKSVDAQAQQKINVGNYQGSAKIIVEALEKEKKKLEELEKVRIRVQNAGASPLSPAASSGAQINRTVVAGLAGRGNDFSGVTLQANAATKEVTDLNKQIENSRKVIEGFSRVTEQPSFLNLSGKVGDATSEIKTLTRSLIELERNGFGNSEGAKKLRAELARMKDDISDTKAEIKALSSDTRGLDLFAGSVSFAADAFQAASGAAVLFGASQEDAAEATKTLVAVQSVANGVKGIANELTTRGTAANKIYAFSQRQINILQTEGIATTNGLKAALATIGFGALIVGIGLLITNFSKIKDAITGATVATKAYEETLADYRKGAGDAIEKTNAVKTAFNQAKDGVISKEAALKIYNETLGDSFGKTNSLTEAENLFNSKAETYIKIMGLKAQANALFAKSAEEAAKGITANNEDQTSFFDKFKAAVIDKTSPGGGTVSLITAQQTKVKELVETTKQNSEDLRKAGEQLANEAIKLSESTNIKTDTPGKTSTKKAADKTKADPTEAISTNFEIYKIEQERRLKLLNQGAADESRTYDKRLADLAEFNVQSLALLNAQLQQEKDIINKKLNADVAGLEKDKKKKGADVKAINAEIATLTANAGEQLKLLEAKNLTDRAGAYDEFYKRLEDLTKKHNAQESILNQLQYGDTIKNIKDIAKQIEKAEEEARAKQLEKEKAFKEQKKELYVQLFREIQSLAVQLLTDDIKREEDALNEKQRLLQISTENKINTINALGLNEIERTKQIAAVQKQAAFQNEQIENRKRRLAYERAKLEKAVNIATIIQETALAVIRALGSKPYTPFNIVLAAITGAIGAVQVAKAIATPLPQFKKGTQNAPAGPALVSEEGPELMIDRSGKISLTPMQPTLVNLSGGEKIIPHNLTKDILNMIGFSQMNSLKQLAGQPNQQDHINHALQTKMLDELKTINKKTGIIINNTQGIESTAYYLNNIKN